LEKETFFREFQADPDQKHTCPRMLALINRILEWFKSIFWKEEMELTLVGLQFSGKTTFVNVIAVSIFAVGVCEFVWVYG